jgi:hypothetical protein
MARRKVPKQGRPKLPADQVKDVLLQVRVQPVEKQGFIDAAQLSGQNVSVWIRDRLRRIARQELEAIGAPVAFLNFPSSGT